MVTNVRVTWEYSTTHSDTCFHPRLTYFDAWKTIFMMVAISTLKSIPRDHIAH